VNISAIVNIAIDEVFLYLEYPENKAKDFMENDLQKAGSPRGVIENFSIVQNKSGYYCNQSYFQLEGKRLKRKQQHIPRVLSR
jgi:hypothetical protein